MGARRMEEYRELRTEATLVSVVSSSLSHTLRSLERSESCACPPARGDVVFLSPSHPPSLSLFRAKHRAFPSLFRPDQVSTRPTQNCISPYLTMHITPRRVRTYFFLLGCFVCLSRVAQSYNVLIYLAREFFTRISFLPFPLS